MHGMEEWMGGWIYIQESIPFHFYSGAQVNTIVKGSQRDSTST